MQALPPLAFALGLGISGHSILTPTEPPHLHNLPRADANGIVSLQMSTAADAQRLCFPCHAAQSLYEDHQGTNDPSAAKERSKQHNSLVLICTAVTRLSTCSASCAICSVALNYRSIEYSATIYILVVLATWGIHSRVVSWYPRKRGESERLSDSIPTNHGASLYWADREPRQISNPSTSCLMWIALPRIAEPQLLLRVLAVLNVRGHCILKVLYAP